MKKIDWTPIFVPLIFAAALVGCAMLVGSVMQEEEASLLDAANSVHASQSP